MAKRIAIWALAGVIAAAGWGIYFSIPGNGPHFSSWVLVYLTIPIAVWARHASMPMSVYQSIAINSATYVLIGLTVELARRTVHRTRRATS